MPPQPPHDPGKVVYLPHGHTVTVRRIANGFEFLANNLNVHHSVFPPGWSILLETRVGDEPPDDRPLTEKEKIFGREGADRKFIDPTLQNDHVFISSIGHPSTTDFVPPASKTRQIAMMLWVTLWWYFHLPPPNPHLPSGAKSDIPEEGRPKGQWRLNIRREGTFRGKKTLPKLERMGLIATEESSVGSSRNKDDGWKKMFVNQSHFWQTDARIYLFTLPPTHASPFSSQTPFPSRPASPSKDATPAVSPNLGTHGSDTAQAIWGGDATGPFASTSNLPTYFPPAPPQYVFTGSVRHPIRPKPPAQGDTFYTRYVPSQGQYLSFRTASLSPTPPTHHGPTSKTSTGTPNFLPPRSGVSYATLPGMAPQNIPQGPTDLELLHDWMNQPRVSAMWGNQGPMDVQEKFLTNALDDGHSFPVIGCWDGKPFGYFEIYWVREDRLGRFVSGRDSNHYDRGIHALVGAREFRGPDRARIWISALVHYCWLADSRTQRVMLEPRVDNERFIGYLEDVGFYKEKEVTFTHKQAALMKIVRDGWDAPRL